MTQRPLLLTLSALLLFPLAASATWTAYNDLAWDNTQTNDRITRLSFIDDADHNLSGALIQHANGLTTGVSVAFATASSSTGFSSVASVGAGTPAGALFNGKVDTARAMNMLAGQTGTLTFTGLDPVRHYRVVLFGNRGNTGEVHYLSRDTQITLTGADSFSNASSAGATISGSQNETTTIFTGTNLIGLVFHYTDIAPGSDGQITFTCGASAGNTYSWYLNTMLVELLPAGTSALPPTVLFTNGAAWKYHSTGQLPASNWTARTYDDGSWSNGIAPLGYGEANPATATVLSYGPLIMSKWPTYYFRKHFTISDAAAVPGLAAQLLVDDGAALYLNGTPIHVTTNLCVPFDNGSWANYAPAEPLTWTSFTISPSLLVSGDNVLAVEVHQDIKNSSDVTLDMTLATTAGITTNQPGNGVTNWQVLPEETWVAFNDLAWTTGQAEIRITRYSFVDDASHDASGPLVKLDGGAAAEVTVTFATNTLNATINGATNAGAPAGWTPADLQFSGKVDMNQWLFFPGDRTGTLTFAGMNPVRRYKVVLFGNRSEPAYTNRATLVTLAGADSFTNVSSAGALRSGALQQTTRITTGINTAGLVFAYSEIAPGSDGQIQLTVAGNGVPADNAYLNTLRVELLPTGGHFVDRDGDGMEDAWEFGQFGPAGWEATGADADTDGDGVPNSNEFLAGTEANRTDSRFAVAALSNRTASSVVLRWPSASGRSYSIQQTAQLSSAWLTPTSGLTATPPLNVYTGATSTNTGFWRVRADGLAGLQITLPLSRMVFQRNNANQAVIPVRGQCPRAATRIDVRAVARQAGQGTTTGWTPLTPAPTNGFFTGKLTALGGWYDLEFKAFTGGTEIAATTLERVGVGEVFVTSGHSVAQGDVEHEANLYATDDRVNTVAKLAEDAATYNMYDKERDPAYAPMTFRQFGSMVKPFPAGNGPYIWAPFAQSIAQNQNVPVLIFNTASGGSTLNWYALSARGLTYGPSIHNAWSRLPYGTLYTVLKKYITLTGVRAILSDNGTNDSSLDPSEDSVLNNYKIWVEQARKDLGFPQLSVVVCLQTPQMVDTSTVPYTVTFQWPHIRRAQERMALEPSCFTGPDYDTLAPSSRYDGTHLSQSGQAEASLKWAQALSNGFFTASTPWQPGY